MTKYQEALTKIKESIKLFHIRCNSESPINEKERFELLQELVNKETPKKPIKDNYEGHIGKKCSRCGKQVWNNEKYCCNCGQHLDWSIEYGK